MLHSLTGNVFEKSNIFIRDLENDTTICDPIIQKLIKGEHVLLIDLCRGFRLSHEPWFCRNLILEVGTTSYMSLK